MKGGDGVLKTIVEKVCVNGKGKKEDSSFIPYLPEAIRGIKKLRFTHIEGKVSCYGGGDSKFGCKDYGSGIYVMSNGEVLAPDFGYDNKIKVTATEKDNKKNKKFWSIDGDKNPTSYDNKLKDVTI